MNLTVHSGDRVDLEVDQEVSEVVGGTADLENPSIFSRRVTSQLTLGNGGSVIIGGLIAENESFGVDRIPVLGDAPLIGPLFQQNRRENTRNEVLILIQAFVVGDDGAARGATDALRKRFREADKLTGKP